MKPIMARNYLEQIKITRQKKGIKFVSSCLFMNLIYSLRPTR